MREGQWLTSASVHNLAYLEALHEHYTAQPYSVPAEWHIAFKNLPSSTKLPLPTALTSSADERIFRLLDAYRTYGHLMAHINPLATQPPTEPHVLSLDAAGFSAGELTRAFPTAGLLPEKHAPLQQIVNRLKAIYCGHIGIEYKGLQDPALESWLQQRLEDSSAHSALEFEQKKMILQYLSQAELLENFLNTKYVGRKRFSLEGAETLIPLLATVLAKGAELGLQKLVLGMTHRGRLNVMANILKKPHVMTFSEFSEHYIQAAEGSGDVKYHKGYTAVVTTPGGLDIHVDLVHNPSHLEGVDSVVEGLARAKQQVLQPIETACQVMPLLIHGDAALAGQGIVYETLQLSRLPGYTTGGTLHLVVNNQIGFTTLPKDARSTRYCTDIAKAFGAPVFHVNAEDPEACVYATQLAIELRQRFHCDVFIDLNCYRKYGHNEGDEPAYTQPLEYQLIRQKRPIRELYRDQLIKEGIVEKQMAEDLEAAFTQGLHTALAESKREASKEVASKATEKMAQAIHLPIQTAVSAATLQQLAERLCQWPQDFKIHRKLQQLLTERLEMVSGKANTQLDWGMAELLAYASLLIEGTAVRLAGQDVRRGTFSHRHAVLVDQVQEETTYCPLQHLAAEQATFEIVNSPLSEYAALGFEYGYSLGAPHALVLWEAQFGDFANGAQVIIDQFIATAEQKWNQRGAVVLLLPHAYEGKGPEHSSARIERFLSLSGDHNWLVACPSLPAQLFHLLRAHVKRAHRQPLIVFTPKELLRHPQCVSPLSALVEGQFATMLPDPMPPQHVQRVAFCSGHIYYALAAARQERKCEDLALLRIEQLYPFDSARLESLCKDYKTCERFYWVQEEPCNMGAWEFIQPLITPLLPKGQQLHYSGRPRSASPATGSYALHKQQHAQILSTLFGQ